MTTAARTTSETSRRRIRLAGTAGAVALLLCLAACGGSGSATPHRSASPSPVPSPTVSSSASASAAPAAVDPLTGGPVSTNGVVAVKIDDTSNGRPQRGINQADVVYIEEAEGGLTRLLAVFNSQLPTAVEAVRSTRAADPEIMAQYGPVAFVTSGGAPVPLKVLAESPLKTAIGDRGDAGITRDSSRSEPYNEVADLAAIAQRLGAPQAKYVGFNWDAATTSVASAPTADHLTVMVGGTEVQFRYDAPTNTYVRYIDGVAQRDASGNLIATENVIVQFCSITTFGQDVDVNGNPNMYTHTVGSGAIAVFRDGHMITGTWSRAAAGDPTTYTTAAGQNVELRPGNVWVVLTATGNKIS